MLLRETIVDKRLNKSKTITGQTREEIELKARTQKAEWDNQWKLSLQKEAAKARTDIMIEKAEKENEKIVKQILELSKIHLINAEVTFDYSGRLKKYKFSKKEPLKPEKYEPRKIIKSRPSNEPKITDNKYNKPAPVFSLLSRKKTEAWKESLRAEFISDHKSWLIELDNCEEQYKKDVINELNRVERVNKDSQLAYEREVKSWQKEKKAFELELENERKTVERKIKLLSLGDSEVVIEVIDLAIKRAKIPLEFESKYVINFDQKSKRMIIDFILPSIDVLPRTKKIDFLKSKNELKQVDFSQTELFKMYDFVCFSILLMIASITFNSDDYRNIEYLVINGYIDTINKANGKKISPVIASVGVLRNDFDKIDLENIDPKAWFLKNRGISSPKLSDMVGIAPILTVSKEDHRFVDAYDVMNRVDEHVNLAAMDWQDFENLIRELFEKEFQINGGEVKITQASRDGGVDAIAFDPDPIRGGKIIIQAKRYTNVVGVSNVRDLYGTVVNEGATKGILVTTSYYGNDAIEFSKDKPLTLLNGNNLLYLLEKHGYMAKIDLEDARKTLISQNKIRKYK